MFVLVARSRFRNRHPAVGGVSAWRMHRRTPGKQDKNQSARTEAGIQNARCAPVRLPPTGSIASFAYSVQNSDGVKTFSCFLSRSDCKPSEDKIARRSGSPALHHEASRPTRIKAVFHKEVRDAINNSRTLVPPNSRRRLFMGRIDDHRYNEAISFLPQCVHHPEKVS